MNKKNGSIFDINIEQNQYIKPDIESKKQKLNYEKDNNIETDDEDKENNDIENVFNEKCRICFDIQSTKENPKLRLCSCKDCIHFECLKRYINTKIEIQENLKGTVKTYICQKFNCDVCLEPYPLRFKILEYNKIYTLIDYNIGPEINHIVLESLDYIKDGTNLKIVHVVQLIDDKIYIGRSTENDILDFDISVSRKHAVLKYNRENGNLTIENRSEKFGTLVLIKGNIKIKEKKICFQVGNSFITAVGNNEFEYYSNDNNSTEFHLKLKNKN